jgi:hypothetical protein
VQDLQWTGTPELVFGTFGQEVLVYRQTFDEANAQSNADANPTGFQLRTHRYFSQPVMGLHVSDLTRDGVNELIVVTLFGAHVFQANLDEALGKVANELDVLYELEQLEKRKEALKEKIQRKREQSAQ